MASEPSDVNADPDPSDVNAENVPRNNVNHISTFVFLDFETTSLLDRKCRITEMCLFAVSRVDMEETGNLPRVINKLTLCLDPQMPVSMTSSNMTGLFNDILEYQKPFTAETVALISAFLNHLKKPICLLAHNGNRFDFPLLVAELRRINQSLDESLLCADSLEAFRSLDGLPARYDPSSNQNTPIKSTATPNKYVSSTAQSPVKRKGTSDRETLNNQSPKVSRQDKNQEGKHSSNNSSMSVEKVKKKLDYKELKTNLKKELVTDTKKEYEGADGIANKDTVESAEIAGEFSGSLEDADYLLALDSVEKSMCEEEIVLKDPEKQSETVNIDINDSVKGGKVHSCSVHTASSELSEPVKPCSVANSTGYFVRHNTDGLSDRKKTVTESEDSPVDGSQVNTGALPISLDKNALLGCKTDGSVFNNRSDSFRTDCVKTENITEPDQKSSSETDFSVTLNVKPYKSIKNTPKTEVSESPFSVSKSWNSHDFDGGKSGLFKTSEIIPVSVGKCDTNGPSVFNECSNVSFETPTNLTNSAASLGFSPIKKTLKAEIQQNPVNSDVYSAQLSSTNHASRTSMNSPEGSSVSSKLCLALASEVIVQTSSSKRTSVPSPASVSGSFQSALSSSISKLNSALATSNPALASSSPALSSPGPSLASPGPALTHPGPAVASTSNVLNSSPGLQRQSYKLEEIYLRKFGCKPLQSHKAEDDCITMVRVAKCSRGFLEWVDRNAVLLKSIKVPF